MLRRRARLLAACLVLAPACHAGGAATVDIERNETVPVRLAITMKGDINVRFTETVLSHFIVRRTTNKDDNAQKSQLLGVEPVDPVKYGNAAFLAGMGLTPYVGDRTYTIPAGSLYDSIRKAQQAGLQPEVGSSIKVEWWPTGLEAGDAESFMRRAKPCRVVVKKLGTRGTLTCPDVTNEAGDKHFSLTLSWTAPATAAATTSTRAP